MLDDVQRRYVAKVYDIVPAVTLLRVNFTLPNPVIADAVVPPSVYANPRHFESGVLDLEFTNLD
ncbi:hypothetical protein, partial [Mesorhizobium sp. M1E.F.Ca.ET.063.01.1.1]|uniref:hypothetical protein n=1 Tax=Mesorhizobium sp. M1E.F.Ca.ET.063.01.1.1 TaxID=2496750 RepID=UPI001AECFA4E